MSMQTVPQSAQEVPEFPKPRLGLAVLGVLALVFSPTALVWCLSLLSR